MVALYMETGQTGQMDTICVDSFQRVGFMRLKRENEGVCAETGQMEGILGGKVSKCKHSASKQAK
jgi:hypothetical protein